MLLYERRDSAVKMIINLTVQDKFILVTEDGRLGKISKYDFDFKI